MRAVGSETWFANAPEQLLIVICERDVHCMAACRELFQEPPRSTLVETTCDSLLSSSINDVLILAANSLAPLKHFENGDDVYIDLEKTPEPPMHCILNPFLPLLHHRHAIYLQFYF